jgi:hypothetical protein
VIWGEESKKTVKTKQSMWQPKISILGTLSGVLVCACKVKWKPESTNKSTYVWWSVTTKATLQASREGIVFLIKGPGWERNELGLDSTLPMKYIRHT